MVGGARAREWREARQHDRLGTGKEQVLFCEVNSVQPPGTKPCSCRAQREAE